MKVLGFGFLVASYHKNVQIFKLEYKCLDIVAYVFCVSKIAKKAKNDNIF